MRLIRRDRELAWLTAALLAALGTVLAGVGPRSVVATAAAAGVAWRVLPAGRKRLAGQGLPYAVAIAVLAASQLGVAGPASPLGWQPLVAIAAYPLLGRTLVHLVARHRRLREADVFVEAALCATAVGIVLHVAVTNPDLPVASTVWRDAAGTFPAMLVGLDAALLVVGGRALSSTEARRGPVGWIHFGVLALTAVHLVQLVDAGRGADPAVAALSMAAMAAFAVAALIPSAAKDPKEPVRERQPFSLAHTVVVGGALLAAPAALAIQAIQGAQPSPAVATGGVLSGMILVAHLVELLRERAATEHQATHDGLTGLPNRTLLVDRLERSISHARRNGLAVGVLFIDLDRFKEVNDTFGHAEGDALLQEIARRLHECVRDEDTVSRLSGDEFVVLLPHLGSAEDVIPVAERLLVALGEPVVVAGERLLVSGSIGLSTYPDDGEDPAAILAAADAAMYAAKDTAGSTWQVFSPRLATEAHHRMQLEAALLDAIAGDELVLHYQPVLEALTGEVVGAEALVRWERPGHGLVMPGDFVPVAERTDLIVTLGEWVVRAACDELQRWHEAGIRDRFISVNVAARHFSCDLVSTVTQALRETGVDPGNLVLELTESTIVDNIDAVAAALTELREMGVQAAIDDFGTGYCGLRYLSTLPVTSLKIDRSFVQAMTPADAAIVGATIAMGHSLGLAITAEGVETVEQQQLLLSLRCDRLQGYLHGRPTPADQLVARLLAERPPGTGPVPLVDAGLGRIAG